MSTGRKTLGTSGLEASARTGICSGTAGRGSSRSPQDAGADFFGITYGSSAVPARIRFAKGSVLLDWHGRGGGVIYERTDGGDPWDASYTADIGDPVSAKTQIATGVWQRQYSAGIVVVNATLSSVSPSPPGERSPEPSAHTTALVLPA